jgi:hypothetical protein
MVPYNSLRQINTCKWQRKDDGEQSQRRYTSKLSDPVAMQQDSDFNILHKRGNPVLPSLCFLLCSRYCLCQPFLSDIIEIL